MLTPRAIMAGQYRLVLAVSTGIRAQGRVLWPSTLQTGQNRTNLPRQKNVSAWQEVFPHAPGADIPALVIAHGSLQKGGSLLLIKGS